MNTAPYSPKHWLDLAQARWQAADTTAALDAWERGVWLLDGPARAAALRELDWSLDAEPTDPTAALYRRALSVAHLDGEPDQVDALAELLPDLRAARPGLRTRTRWLLLELLRPALGEGSPELTRERSALAARLDAPALDPTDAPAPAPREVARAAALDLLEAAETLAESVPVGRSLSLAQTAWIYAGLGEHLRALQAAEEAERWWSDVDAGARTLSQPLVAAVRQRVSGADAGDADFEESLDRLRNHPTAQAAEAIVRCLDQAFAEGVADARWVESALALTGQLEPRQRLRAVDGALPAWRRFGAERASGWAREALSQPSGDAALDDLALGVLARLDRLEPTWADAWLTRAAARAQALSATDAERLLLASRAGSPQSPALAELTAAAAAHPLAALLVEAAQLAQRPAAERGDLSPAIERAFAGPPRGSDGAQGSARNALASLLPLLPGSPGGEALLRESCRRLLDDPSSFPEGAISAGLSALADGRQREAALSLLHTVTPKLHMLLGSPKPHGAAAALDALTRLAPPDLPAQLRACASVNAHSAAIVGQAAAAAGLADVCHEAFGRVWPALADFEAPVACDCVHAALTAAACAIPDACGVARRALAGLDPHLDELGPFVGLLIPLLEPVVAPRPGPDDALRAARERAQLRAGLWS